MTNEWTRQEHIDHLKELEKNYGNGWLTFPKVEGSLYFGNYLTYDEHVDRYRDALLDSLGFCLD